MSLASNEASGPAGSSREDTAAAATRNPDDDSPRPVVSLDERVFEIMSGERGLEECGPDPRIVRWFECWASGE